MTITRKEIRNMSNSRTFQRGEALKQAGAVFSREEYEDGDMLYIRADVESSGDYSYHVTLDIDLECGEIIEYSCECPAYFNYEGLCKHCVATALYYTADKSAAVGRMESMLGSQLIKQGMPARQSSSPQLENLIRNYSVKGKTRYLQPSISGRVELVPTLHRNYNGWSVDFKIGIEQKYVVKDLHSFVEALQKRTKVDYGKKLGFIHEYSAFTQESRELVSFVVRQVETYQYFQGGRGLNRFYYFPSMRALELTDEALGELFHLFLGKEVAVDDYRSNSRYLEILGQNPVLSCAIEQQNNGSYQLVLPAMEAIRGKDQLYVRRKEQVYECSSEFSDKMDEICQLGNMGGDTILAVAPKDMPSFCSTILPVLQEHTTLHIDGSLEEYIPGEAMIKIYLDSQPGYVTALLTAEYGDKTYNLLEPVDMLDAFRNVEKESLAVSTTREYFTGMSTDNRFFIEEEEEDQIYHLLTAGLLQIAQTGEIYLSESFRKLKVVAPPKVQVGISLSGNLIDIQIDGGRLTPEEIQGVLANYKKKKKYYRMRNGEFLNIEDNSMEMVTELTDGLNLTPQQVQQGLIQVPKYRAFYLDQVTRQDREGVEVFRNQTFKAMIRDMKSVEDSDYQVPDALKNVLRNYQKTGFRWLSTLEDMGFGGILADDMGLGKTLQIICFLLAKKQQSKEQKTSIIICPASLVYNWQSEVEKFAPQLKVLMVAGNAEQRRNQLHQYQEYDVVITSYDLLKRDVEEYSGLEFYGEIIDEAQNIKNHTTMASKAVKSLKAQWRFALTGTPIENRLSELWSIFDYLMPGFLNTYERFRIDYEMPIVQSKDETMTARLQKMIKPFILRRIKSEVLKDLPEKEENIVYSKLEGEQKLLYTASVQKMVDSIGKKSKEEVNSNKLQILAELTRLRQICCEPSMVYEGFKGSSAKMDTCMELLENALAGGHKVLLFSQFTSLFTVLEKRLKKQKIEYYKLTGSTPKAARMELVDKFNHSDNPVSVFLISLKAGGTGLNLTGADIVIHFDPWWNVAAQNQATDRAHRIGQKNQVSVFRLIAKDTIEEKILSLQETKKDLSDQIISGGGVSVSNLTKEDFIGLLEE